MVFPKNFEEALLLYENKFLQLNNRKLNLTKENFDQVIRNNKFEYLAFIQFFKYIGKKLKGDLKIIIEKLVNDCYYSKVGTRELSLNFMAKPEGYSHDLSEEPLYKTCILY